MQTEPNSEAAPIKKRSIVLRAANMDDVARILEGIDGYFQECALEGYPSVSVEDASSVLTDSVNHRQCIVAECDGAIAGSFGFRIVPWTWNFKKSFLLGDWLYVKPRFRAGGTGSRLIKVAIEIADLNGTAFMFTLHSKFEKEMIARVLTSHGFSHVGGNFVYFPKVWTQQ